MLGANSKTKLLNSNLVIFNLSSIFGRLAPASNKETVGQHAPEEANKRFLLFTGHGARGVTVPCSLLVLVRQALEID